MQSDATDRLLARLARAALLLAGAALVAMAGVELWQVFARYVLNASPGWTEPTALFLLSTAMSFGAAAAVRSWSHFGFFILVQRVPAAAGRALQAGAYLIVAALGVTLAICAAELLFDGIGIPAAGTVLPQSAAFLPIALGGALMAVFALERLFAAPEPEPES